MVGEPVQQCAGQTFRAEYPGPFVERQVGGHQSGAALVTLAEHPARARGRCRWRARSGSPQRCLRRAGGARGDGAGGAARGAAAGPGLYGQGDGGADRPCAVGPDRSGQPGAVRPHRRPAGALRLCRQPRPLALGSAGRTRALRGRGARRRVRRSAERPGAVGGGSAASRRIHARNARSSGRCREAAVVIRQQRSGASFWWSKSGTRIRRSSSWAISIGRPMAAPSPLAAAWISIE